MDTVGHRLERKAVLCTAGAAVYQRYAQYRGVTHEPVNLAQGIRVRQPAFHVQNVNDYHNRWKGWVACFHGVASRHRNKHLGLHPMLDAMGDSVTPHSMLVATRGHAYQHSTMTWPRSLWAQFPAACGAGTIVETIRSPRACHRTPAAIPLGLPQCALFSSKIFAKRESGR